MVPGDGIFAKELGQEDGALMSGTSVLMKETPANSLPSPSTVGGYNKKLAVCNPEDSPHQH